MTMADGYLEKHYDDYEARKAAWQRRLRHQPKARSSQIDRPEDEAL